MHIVNMCKIPVFIRKWFMPYYAFPLIPCLAVSASKIYSTEQSSSKKLDLPSPVYFTECQQPGT